MNSDDLIPDQTLQLGGSGQLPTPESTTRLIVVVGASQGARLELDRGADEGVVIGRNGDCDLVLDSPVVSGNHAQVTVAGDGYAIRDLNSTNGVRVNDVKLEPGEVRTLQHGDAIQLSDHMLLFVSRRSIADQTNFSTIQVDGEKASSEAEALLREFGSLRLHRTD